MFYAVAVGYTVGVFTSWDECKKSVSGFPKASYKKFATREEAERFIERDVFVPDYYVYTDGACIHNGYANAVAGIGVYINDDLWVSERIEGKTNQIAELSAILRALQMVGNDKVIIVSDSEYAIRCATGHYNSVTHNDLVEQIRGLIKNVRFMHVNSHTGLQDLHSLGNERADQLASCSISNVENF
jgi:viroplasmin and RNaseH domain-containing protein